MDRSKRSAREIANELKVLAQRPDEDRNRVALLHEVQVYQEELIVQNEALGRALTALEETRDQFVELYDFAPCGYLTLDAHGMVRRINLTGTSLLGKPRSAIEGMPLLGFVAVSHRPQLLDFLRQCRACDDGGSLSLEVPLGARKGHNRHVQLICRPRTNHGSGAREYLTAMSDVSERKRLEADREQVALERAALASRLLSIQDEERQRIARDLHDNIGQHVTALRLKLAAIGSGGGAEAQAQVEAVERLVGDLDRELDFIARELRPAALDLGVITALRQFVLEWSKAHGIGAEFHASGFTETRLPPTSETHLYRVTQEALNNVYKHAQATRVSILLEHRGRDAVLIIEDDGSGFNPDAPRTDASSGLGLVSMRERAQIIGGSLDVESQPGKGTTIFLRIPGPGRRASSP
jgi:PAS domain S-box-containing protein